MTDRYRFEDGEAVNLVHGLSDERRLSLIARAIARDTPHGRRIAELLMAIHLHERMKSRDVVNWALGNTLH